MNLTVSGIVGGVNEHNSIVNTVCVDDWAVKSAIKASNDIFVKYSKGIRACVSSLFFFLTLTTQSETGVTPSALVRRFCGVFFSVVFSGGFFCSR